MIGLIEKKNSELQRAMEKQKKKSGIRSQDRKNELRTGKWWETKGVGEIVPDLDLRGLVLQMSPSENHRPRLSM